MSRNRRPQGGSGLRASQSWRENRAFKITKLREDARRDARHEEVRLDRKAGDCAACGWITGRSACPMCGAAIPGQENV